MSTAVKIFGILAAVAAANIVFFSGNSSQVIGSVFSGASGLFGTLEHGGGGGSVG